jgi:hypothetical protein
MSIKWQMEEENDEQQCNELLLGNEEMIYTKPWMNPETLC